MLRLRWMPPELKALRRHKQMLTKQNEGKLNTRTHDGYRKEKNETNKNVASIKFNWNERQTKEKTTSLCV